MQTTKRRPGGGNPARPEPRAPPARAARGRAGLPPPGRRLVFCIYLVYAQLEANILILGCWQPLTRVRFFKEEELILIRRTDTDQTSLGDPSPSRDLF